MAYKIIDAAIRACDYDRTLEYKGFTITQKDYNGKKTIHITSPTGYGLITGSGKALTSIPKAVEAINYAISAKKVKEYASKMEAAKTSKEKKEIFKKAQSDNDLTDLGKRNLQMYL